MRRIHTLLGTGCFFLLAGGWVCSGQVTGAGPARDANAAALDAAVAAAVPALTATAETPAAPPMVIAAPASQPAATEPASTNLNSAVVNVAADGTVEQFNAQDLDINTALHFLSLQSKRNIIASKEVKGTVTANLYNVTFAEALDSLLSPNGFGYMEKGNFIYVYTQKELEDIKKRDRKTVNRVFRLKYMTAADASVLIKPALSSVGQIALTPPAVSGLPTGVQDTGGPAYATDDTVVINDYPENLSEVEKTLKQLDVRPKQVLIESSILSVTLNEDNALGVDFISLSGLDFASLGGAKITNDVDKIFHGVPTSPTNAIPTTPPKNFIGTDATTGGLSVGFLSSNINFFIHALETIGNTTVLANPKILALNKHRGEVFIGQQVGYKTTTLANTTTVETVQFFDTGTKLIFRPYITDDGYVRMEVHPEDSDFKGNADLPGKISTEITSNLMIKDGRTVVIGGLFREKSDVSRGQVPILGNIPILGVPFRKTHDITDRREMIVLLTPHIINDDTALYEESLKTQEDMTRMMLGNRAGMQPWGRDRVAQTWYAKAQECLAVGNREKALMFTDWALNTNPTFLEAIHLREQLTGQKVQEASESSIASFVRDVIKDDRNTIPNPDGSGHYPPSEPTPAAPVPTTAPTAKP